MSKLNPIILLKLKEKTGMSEQAIRNAVSNFKNNKCPKSTQNAAAQLFAKSRGLSVAKYLKKEDRDTLPSSIEFEKPIKIKKSKSKLRKKKIIELVKFETADYFLKKHLEEINRTYTFHCYTSSYILCRKVIENLLIEILRKKYPSKNKGHKELYFDISRGRFLDLKYILKNLSEKSKEFGSEKELVERLIKKAEEFKEDANNKTHSLYHIVTNKKELDEKNPQEILEYIKALISKI